VSTRLARYWEPVSHVSNQSLRWEIWCASIPVLGSDTENFEQARWDHGMYQSHNDQIDSYIQLSAQRAFEKMQITKAERHVAILTLAAFFQDKLEAPDRLLILPQVADWVWHEMVADTAGYRTFLRRQGFGEVGSNADDLPASAEHSLLASTDHALLATDHSMMVPADHSVITVEHVSLDSETEGLPRSAVEVFEATSEHFKTSHGIDFAQIGWTDAGWASPAYRLRETDSTDFRNFTLSPSQHVSLRQALDGLSPAMKARDASWLDERIERRYPASKDAARLASVAYQVLLDARRSDLRPFADPPTLIDWAHFEHVLWTRQYRDDCTALFGGFLDRPVPSGDCKSGQLSAQDRDALIEAGLGDAAIFLSAAGTGFAVDADRRLTA